MKLTTRLTTLFLLLVLGASANAQPVLFGGTGNHYEFFSDNVTWEEAEQLAATHEIFGVQGHLATLTTQEENDFLFDTFGGASGWIGLFQEPGSTEPDQGFRWVTDEELVYTNWNGGEPNNAGGNEQFVEYFNSRWNDLSPTSGRRYYVEYETSAIPEPSGIALLAAFSVLWISRRRTFK